MQARALAGETQQRRDQRQRGEHEQDERRQRHASGFVCHFTPSATDGRSAASFGYAGAGTATGSTSDAFAAGGVCAGPRTTTPQVAPTVPSSTTAAVAIRLRL